MDKQEVMFLRVFLDSSVFIAAAGSDKGSRSASVSVLRCAELGLIKLVTSETVVEEVENNIRKKIASDSRKNIVLAAYYQLMKEIDLEVISDPSVETYKQWATVTEL